MINVGVVRLKVAKYCVAIGETKLAKEVLETLKTDDNSMVRLAVAKSHIKLAKSLVKN